jgi:hypothetical protein
VVVASLLDSGATMHSLPDNFLAENSIPNYQRSAGHEAHIVRCAIQHVARFASLVKIRTTNQCFAAKPAFLGDKGELANDELAPTEIYMSMSLRLQ